MEIPTNSSWLMYFMKVLVRNSVLPLNICLWLSVLYFSLFDDERAALLSYTLTAFMIEYASPGISINAPLIYRTSFILQVLTSCDILLGIFHQFWKTAFYSVCFGVFILQMKYEISLRTEIYDMKVLYEDTKDNGIEFVRVIPNKTDIKLHKVAKDETRLTQNKIKVLNKDCSDIFPSQDGKRDSSFRGNSDKLKVKHEKTSEKDDQILYKNSNILPLDMNETLNQVSLDHDLNDNFFVQSNENILQRKNTETRSLSFIKQDEFSLKYGERLFESTSECGGTMCPLKMSEPLQLALTSFDLSNTKLNSKQTEVNCVSSEECTVLNNKTLKESKSRNEVLKQSNTINDMMEHITRPSTKVKNESLNALINTDSHVPKDVSLGQNSSSNLSQQNLDNLIDQLCEKFVNSYNTHFLELNKKYRMLLDIDEQPKKSTKEVSGMQTTGNSKSNVMAKVSQTKNPYDTDETSNSEAEHRSTRQSSIKASDFQDETETRNNFKDFLLSESSPESNVLNSMDIYFDDKILKINDRSSNAESSNGLNEPAKKSFENESETPFFTVNDVEGAVNRIDMSFIYAL